MLDQFPLFDSHFHIIDKDYPLVENQGFMPDEFTCEDYLKKTSAYDLCGGAIVSGSFQAFDQGYLVNALKKLGPSFVGVTQLPMSVSNDDILSLHNAGVRALRFNLKRGGSEEIGHLTSMAKRVHEIAGWHVELYVDSKELDGLFDCLIALPKVSIDHLGLSYSGLKTLTKLVEKGVRVKATGFGRVDFKVQDALKVLYKANPKALMFGTDLPSTRAPRTYEDRDFLLIAEALGLQGAKAVLSQNATEFYQPKSVF